METGLIEARLVSVYGDDLMVANALRRSFNQEHSQWHEVARGPRERSDRQLVEDCAREGDELPFRHPHATFACSAPIPVARQLGKHQVGLDWSEVSRRYKTKGIAVYRIGRRWREKPTDVRQGTGQLLPAGTQARLSQREERVISVCWAEYQGALADGATPEQARFLLPQSMMVDWTWTGSLLAWANLFKRRSHPKKVQMETQEFAKLITAALHPKFPVSWPALISPWVLSRTQPQAHQAPELEPRERGRGRR